MNRLGFSWQLLRHNVSLYLGAAVMLLVAMVVTSIELLFHRALGEGQGILWEVYSADEQRALMQQMAGLRVLLTVACILAVGVATALVHVGLANALSRRSHEFATMRLLGASPGQVRRMVMVETMLLAAWVGVAGLVLGQLLAQPFFVFIRSLGVFGALQARIGWYPDLWLMSLTGFVAVTAASTWWSARTLTRDLPDPRPRQVVPIPPTRRRLVVAVTVIAATLGCILAVRPGAPGVLSTLFSLAPLLVVLPLTALAPFLVPTVARVVALIISPVLPGPGRLLARRAARDAYRFSGAVMPILVVCGLVGGFHIGNVPHERLLAAEQQQVLRADLVVDVPDIATADEVVSRLARQSGVEAMMRWASSNRPVIDGRKSPVVFHAADRETLPAVLDLPGVVGDAAHLTAEQVLAIDDPAAPGTSLRVQGVAGEYRMFTVEATAGSERYGGIVVDWSLAGWLGGLHGPVRVFVVAPGARGTVEAVLHPLADRGVVVTTREEHIHQGIVDRRHSAAVGNAALFGTTFLLGLVTLAQGAAASTTQRGTEFRLLRTLGVSRGGIVGLVMVETVTLLLSASLLIAVALAFIGWRYFAVNPVVVAGPGIPWEQIVGTFGIMAVALVVPVLISCLLTLRRTEEMMAPRPTRVFAGGFLEPLLAAFALLFSAVEPLPPGLFGWLATVLCFTGAATVGRIPRGGAAAVLAGLLVWSLGLRLVSFLGLVGLLIVVGSWAFRGRQHALSLGVVGVAVMVMAGTSHPGRDVAALLGLVAVVWGSGLSVFRATQRVKRVQAEHEGAVRRIQQELARDLHDRIAHAQAVVVMKADTLLECDNLSAVTRAEVMAIAQVTREASESLQRMLATLRRVDAPQRPDAPVGNSAPLGEQVTRLRRMGFTVLVEGSPEKIPAKVLPVIADVLVEAANNVIRHGDPRHPCVVSVACDPLGVGLQVTNAVVTPGPSSPGLGLVGIEERVRSVGGHSDWGHYQDRWWLRLRLPT